MSAAELGYKTIRFMQDHGGYLLLPIVLFVELRYLLSSKRKESIGMRGWGTAERRNQPAFYWTLWSLHILCVLFFALLLLGYLLDNIFPAGESV